MSAASVRQAAIDAMVSGYPDRAEHVATAAAAQEEAGAFWPVETSVLADAHAQSRPYAGDTKAEDRAWAARVDAAVQGMDLVDPAGLDAWMQTHAESDLPHAHEADLVAVWETHVRDAHSGDIAEDVDEDGW